MRYLFIIFLFMPSLSSAAYLYNIVPTVGVRVDDAISSIAAAQEWCSNANNCHNITLNSTYDNGYGTVQHYYKFDNYYPSPPPGSYAQSNTTVVVIRTIGSCPSGYTDDGNGNCVQQPQDCRANEGQQSGAGSYKTSDIYAGGGVISPRFFCSNDCLQQPVCETTQQFAIQEGVEVGYSTCYMEQTAFECQAGDAPSPIATVAPPEDTCKAGDKYGTLNGQKICLQPNGELANTKPPTVTESQTDNTSVDNGDGTSTNTSTETSTDGQGNTTTTTTTTIIDNSTGEPQSETVTEETDKPDNKFADNGCDAQPACTGDAVQCAIAQQQHELNCKFEVDEVEITAAALGVDGEEDSVASLEGDDSIFDISNLIDTTPFLAGSCPSPQQVNLGSFGTHDISYAPLCSLAEILSYLVLASAGFLSIRIIGS